MNNNLHFQNNFLILKTSKLILKVRNYFKVTVLGLETDIESREIRIQVKRNAYNDEYFEYRVTVGMINGTVS